MKKHRWPEPAKKKAPKRDYYTVGESLRKQGWVARPVCVEEK